MMFESDAHMWTPVRRRSTPFPRQGSSPLTLSELADALIDVSDNVDAYTDERASVEPPQLTSAVVRVDDDIELHRPRARRA